MKYWQQRKPTHSKVWYFLLFVSQNLKIISQNFLIFKREIYVFYMNKLFAFFWNTLLMGTSVLFFFVFLSLYSSLSLHREMWILNTQKYIRHDIFNGKFAVTWTQFAAFIWVILLVSHLPLPILEWFFLKKISLQIVRKCLCFIVFMKPIVYRTNIQQYRIQANIGISSEYKKNVFQNKKKSFILLITIY